MKKSEIVRGLFKKGIKIIQHKYKLYFNKIKFLLNLLGKK